MNVRWVVLICLIQSYINPVAAQHYRYYNEAPPQYGEEIYDGDSDDFSDDQMKRSARQEIKIMDSETCFCTCEDCYTGVPACCGDFCRFCPAQGMPMGNLAPYGAPPQSEQKLVFVPFPYPLVLPDKTTTPAPTSTTTKPTAVTATTTTEKNTSKPTTTITTPKPTTTTTYQTTTTSKRTTNLKLQQPNLKATNQPKKYTKKGFRLRANNLEYDMLARHRQLMQLNPVVKRRRPPWVPKYGIVPIPDHLAAKLMTELTEVRALRSKNI